MKVISRRGFFQSLGGEMATAATEASKEIGLANLRESPTAEELGVGHVADYAPGKSLTFRQGDIIVEVISFEDGIRARRRGEMGMVPIAIRMDREGRLFAQLTVGCGEHEVFSILCDQMKLP